MGGCGIWSMHFIANRAVILEGDVPEKQIEYSPGFTALSAFLPVLVLSAAFYFLGSNRSKSRPLYLVLAGVLTGTAVCGMHYVGNAGIQNYSCRYKPANIAGSAVIAVIASLVALSVFFRLREDWTDSWWKRALCALVLAGAVCGMHWTAAVGTSYIEGETNRVRGGTTRVQTVIVCAVLVCIRPRLPHVSCLLTRYSLSDAASYCSSWLSCEVERSG
jgi:NO-binding membrane sensor protein with MHYT domain